MNSVKLCPYSSEFTSLFSIEKGKLEKVLPISCKIEHFGSTAIPNLGGKGAIDIMIICRDNIQRKKVVQILVKKGYILDKSSPDKNRIFLASSKDESDRGDIHLHLTLEKTKESKMPLFFRDYLKLNPDVAQRYAKLKYILKEQGLSRKEYTKLKRKFIEEIEDLAEKYFQEKVS